MAYVTSEARQELLDTVAEAIDELAGALAALGEAYELLDENAADKLEEMLFRPVQVAYGRLQRTHTAFADRHGMPTRTFAPGVPGPPSLGFKGFLDAATESVAQAEAILVELQDSLSPVQVGDPELRAGLAEVRELMGTIAARTDEVLRTFGR